MDIFVKKLHQDATIPNFAHESDAGADLCAVEDVTIAAGTQTTIATGIAMQVADGYVGLVWDKSGISAKRRLKVMGGVIDAGYRGEILVTLANLGDTEQSFKKGEKIAQLLIQPVLRPRMLEVNELDDTTRGSGGFGSTGL